MNPLWMVRTSQNQISGPFPEAHIRELIQSGKLGLQDEVCVASGYWFFLHEAEELKKHLGLEMPKRQKQSGEENTETETETQTEPVVERTDPELVMPNPAQSAAQGAEPSEARDVISEPSARPQDDENETTTVVRPFDPKAEAAAAAAPRQANGPEAEASAPEPQAIGAPAGDAQAATVTRMITGLVILVFLAMLVILAKRFLGRA